MSNRSFFIGPSIAPITGQSNCYKVLADHFSGERFFYLFESKRKTFKEIIIYYLEFFKRRPSLVYLSFSRSVKGFLRDSLFLLPCLLYRPKIVFHLHGSDFESFVKQLPFPLKWFYKRIFGGVDMLIVLTDQMFEDSQFVRRFNPKIQIETIQNFYPHQFDDIKKTDCIIEESADTPLKLLYFSNVLYSKGIVDLIFATIRCADELGQKVQLEIAGQFMSDGYLDVTSMENYFLDLIKDKSYITFHGPVRNMAKKKRIFAKSQVIILPTFYPAEAFPLSLIEGMASGNAIVTTHHNHLDQVFPNDSGIFVEPKVSNQLVDAISFYSKNRDRLFDTQSFNYQYARENLSTASHLTKIKSVLGMSPDIK